MLANTIFSGLFLMVGFAVYSENRSDAGTFESEIVEINTQYGPAFALCVVAWVISWVIAGINGFILCQSTY